MELPIAPRPYSNEIISSWIARVGSRYDMSINDFRVALAENLILDKYSIDDSQSHHAIDYQIEVLETEVLSKATRVPVSHVNDLVLKTKFPNIPAEWVSHQWSEDVVDRKLVRTGDSAWSFCNECLAEDIKDGKDPFIRRDWILSCFGYCHRHHSQLRQRCINCNAEHKLEFLMKKNSCRLICRNCLHEQHIDPSKRTSWDFAEPGYRAGDKYIKRGHEFVIKFENDLFKALNGKRVPDRWIGPTSPAEFVSAIEDHLFLLTANFRAFYPRARLISQVSYYGFPNIKNITTSIDIPYPAAHQRPSMRRLLFAAVLASFGAKDIKRYFHNSISVPFTSRQNSMEFIWTHFIEHGKIDIRKWSKRWPINLRERFDIFVKDYP